MTTRERFPSYTVFPPFFSFYSPLSLSFSLQSSSGRGIESNRNSTSPSGTRREIQREKEKKVENGERRRRIPPSSLPFPTAAPLPLLFPSVPTIKRLQRRSACICTRNGRYCCSPVFAPVLSRRSRAWALCRGTSRARCRTAREPTIPGQQPRGWSGDPSSSRETCRYNPEWDIELNLYWSLSWIDFISSIFDLSSFQVYIM